MKTSFAASPNISCQVRPAGLKCAASSGDICQRRASRPCLSSAGTLNRSTEEAGHLGSLFLLPECLQSRCDFRLLIEAGKLIRPGAIPVQMSAYIGDQVAEPFAFVIPCDLVMRVTEDPLDGIGPWTVRRKPQQFEARMSIQPTLDGLRFVNFVVTHDHIDVVIMTSRITDLERVEQISEQRVGFARPGTIMNDSSAAIPGTCQIMLFVLAGREHLHLCALRHPLVTRLRQQMN